MQHENNDQNLFKMIDKSPTLPTPAKQKYDCNHDCDALYEACQKGKEDALKETSR